MLATITDEIMAELETHGPQTIEEVATKLTTEPHLIKDAIVYLENQGRVSVMPETGLMPNPFNARVTPIVGQSSKCVLDPFPGRCVVERENFKMKSSIVIPGQAKRTPTIGVVVKVGDSSHDSLVGKRVLFARHSGVPIYMSGHPQYDIFDYAELLAIVNTTDKIEFELDDVAPLYQD